ncbi:MAG: phytoene/squalene synthase family protein [Myxococcota bacterium]
MTPSPAECRAVLAEGSKSFHFASRFLPAGRRDDAAVVYAFCRTVDDIADEGVATSQARSELTELRAELSGQRPPRPLAALLLSVAERRRFSPEPALHLIDGVLSDLETVRIADDEALRRYCYRVAGTVGLLMCGVLGVRAHSAAPFAVDLGIAMQLTNICRDVREDAERGRVYLPLTRLASQGLDAQALLAGAPDREGLRIVVAELLEMADGYYASAEDGMRFIPWRARFAILVASRVYRAIGVKLRRGGANPWKGRTVVSPLGKLGVALGALLRGCHPKLFGLWPTPRHPPALHRGLAGLPGTTSSELPRLPSRA